jgi:small GTP-binding protein
MPANLNHQYFAAEERYKEAKNDREKLKALKEMLAVIPKHKGTEKLQGDIKKKISQLREDKQNKKGKGPKRFSYSINKEGAGQVGMVGPPSVGKSQLVNSLANVSFDVADYSFTTRMFQPAMMPFEDIQVQLIDLPPISNEYMENWLPSIIKSCDAVLLVFDFSRDDLLEQIETTLEILEYHKIKVENENIDKNDSRWTILKSLLIANKIDLSRAEDNLSIFKEFYGNRFSALTVSAKEKTAIETLRQEIVTLLDVVRIYSKLPAHEPELNNPFVLQRGKTLLDFAKVVHKDFADSLKFARVWGSNKFDGQRITKDYILEDKDIIELHQ